MADTNSVGGVRNLAKRYDAPQRHAPDRSVAPGARDTDDGRKPSDAVFVTDGQHIAFPLLRERVLAATRTVLGGSAHSLPVTAEAEPNGPADAVAQVQHLQRRCAGTRTQDPLVQQQLAKAFVAGMQEAIDILRDVGQFDVTVANWFLAVASAVGRGPSAPGLRG